MEQQYGIWDSQVSLDLLCNEFNDLRSVVVNPNNGDKYLLEGRGSSKNVIVRINSSGAKDILPAQYSVESKVHEYGGLAYAYDAYRDQIVFSNEDDQGVYLLNLESGNETPIVCNKAWRFADFEIHEEGWIACIREVHDLDNDKPDRVINELVLLHPKHKEVKPLVNGNDFYTSPRFSPDGKSVCWMEWANPEMPWTGSQLCLADFDAASGTVSNAKLVAGAGKEQSVGQPRWGPDGTLFFVDDVTGFWQLYQLSPSSTGKVEKVETNGLEEMDHAVPEWFLGTCTYLPLSSTKIILTYRHQATSHIAELDLATKSHRKLALPVIEVLGLAKVSPTTFTVLGAGATTATSLYEITLGPTTATTTTTATPTSTLLRRSVELDIPATHLSTAQHLSFPRTQGAYQHGLVHGFFFPPCNPSFRPPPNTLPPLIVMAHGGPTSSAKPSLAVENQYWTSRGYALFLVNYAGSTSYGRDYLRLLNGRWGEIDAADAASAAVGLAQQGLVDGTRMGVWGPSAGGFVVLKTICDSPAVWSAAVSLFGVADTKGLVVETHKFEGRYMCGLLFGAGWEGLGEEESERVHFERSPVWHAAKVQAPTLLLQGSEDRVVPVEQAVRMEEALKKEGKTVRLEVFEGQGHSFWRGEARRRMFRMTEGWWVKYLIR